MSEEQKGPDRRSFLATAAMTGGLVAGYGTFAGFAGAYLYPAGDAPKAWLFVTETARLPVGGSIEFKTPSGAKIVVARQDEQTYLALSSTCPHLGCSVHWEPTNDRFFCPCHEGVFNAKGEGTAGPPEGQSLLRYPTKVENGLLYIETPLERLARGPERPGHDACLRPRDEV